MSKIGKISVNDGKKSIRDAFMVAGAALGVQVFEILGAVDFGEYSFTATIVLAALLPLVNRYLRNKTT